MKTLLLMRHAKSSWKRPGLADWERPLNKRGRRDAPRMGDLLWDEDLVPQRILSSSAQRARQTAQAVAETAGYGEEILYLDELYGAAPPDYLEALRAVGDEMDPVLVIGHNPGLEDLLGLLTEWMEHLPTAAVAHLRLPIGRWRDLRGDTVADLVQIWRPRELA